MTKTITITEALADFKVIQKRIEAKRQAIGQYTVRQEAMKDPLERRVEGGSPTYIEQEMQAMSDLVEQQVAIRRVVAQAAAATTVTVEGMSRSISEWLTWRREVAPGQLKFLRELANGIERARAQVTQRGGNVLSATASIGDSKPTDLIVNVDEAKLLSQIEQVGTILETLDGQLSLKNATVTVTY